MAGLANDNSPFLANVRVFPVAIQLVPGPPGPSGSGALAIWNNGSVMPTEPVLNFIGFTLTDVSGISTNITAVSDLTSPVVNPGSALTPSQTWVEFTNTAGTILLPASPVVGRRILFTHTAGLLEPGSGNPVTLSGNGHNVIDPQDLLAVAASSVTMRTSGVNYTFAFDGTVFRCVGLG